MSDLSIRLNLDLAPFGEGLKNAMQLAQTASAQITGVLSGTKAKVNFTSFNAQLKAAQANLNKLKAEPVNLNLKLDVGSLENDARRVQQSLQQAASKGQSSLNNLQNSLSNVGFALSGLRMSVQLFMTPLNKFLASWGKQESAQVKVTTAVRQTGQAAGYTAQQLFDMASELQKVTKIGDELILDKVTAQLLTFTNIAGEQFALAQEAALDLATLLSGDLQGAAIQLGKALNDPAQGLTALSRSGVTFTETEKALIKSLWDTGRQAEAQTVILKALNGQYGGQARAAAAGSGALAQFKNNLGDLSELAGKMLVDVLSPLAKLLSGLAETFKEYPVLTKAVAAGLMGVGIAAAALTIKVHALNIAKAIGAALSGNWIALGAAAALGLGVWGAATLLQDDRQKQLNERISQANQALTRYKSHLADLTKVELLEARAQLVRRQALLATLEMDEKTRQQHQEEITKSLTAVREELKQRYAAQASFAAAKAAIDHQATLSQKQALTEQIAAQAQAVATMKANTAEQVQAKTEAYQKLVELEKQLGQITADEAAKRQELSQKYALAAIANELERGQREIILQEQAELEKARALNASAETLLNIRKSFALKRLKLEEDTQKRQAQAAAQEQAEKERKLAEENRHAQEVINIRRSTNIRLLELQGKHYEAELAKFEEAWEKRKAAMIAAGISEMEISNLYNSERDNLLKQSTSRQAESLEAEMSKLELHWEWKRNFLHAKGYTELEIERMYQDARLKLQNTYAERTMYGAGNLFGNLAKVAQAGGKKYFGIWKALAISQATVNAFASAVATRNTMSFLPWPAPEIFAAAALAAGLANVAMISKQKYTQARLGGILAGPSHARGGILIQTPNGPLEAEGGEGILSGRRMQLIGTGFFNFLNFAPEEAVKRFMSMMGAPSLPMPANAYSPVMAQGVIIGGGSGYKELVTLMTELVNENRLLRQDIARLQPQ